MNNESHSYQLYGLSEKEVLASREKYGMNVLTPPKRPSVWKLYLEKFKDPVIRILLVAAFLSLCISFVEGGFAETIGIFFAIFLATGISFYFEYDANKMFDLLNEVTDETLYTVIREGSVHKIPKRDIVVGDIVVLNTGEEIPADGILKEAISLQINESTLTGEPLVHKTINKESFDKEATYPSNEVMRGTTVLDGHGVMQVQQVGDATEFGKVARQATSEETEDTPLNIQLKKLANWIGTVGFSVAALAFVIFTTRDLMSFLSVSNMDQWHDVLQMARIILKYFMMAVTLIVVAVPEGLPMSVSLSLALNMRRMLKTNNLVRKMHACETMGAITVICTDKTGTLTQNRMLVNDCKLDEQEEPLITEGISVNSTAFLDKDGNGLGNPTEVALLLWLKQQGKDYLKIREQVEVIDQLSFSTERKYMATLVESLVRKGRILYVKGAPEIVMARCDISPEEQQRYTDQLVTYQNKAMRTLALAYCEIDSMATADCLTLMEEHKLKMLGIYAISDPIREDIPAAVQKCQSAGIDVKIVTGDTQGTTTEIARQIGLWTDQDTEENRITGPAFAALTDEEASDRISGLKIMSRARPMDKQRLVQLLQKKKAVVAVTGDGTNDAPALHHAQVGLSMGSGTSVAKEASDITLLDDSFNSIATAVMWGRSLYRNIQRFIVFQLTINLVALASVIIGAFFGTELPLTVTQMLWVNLIMDTFAAMALASIPPSSGVMSEKPRNPEDFIITKNMKRFILIVGLIFLVILMGIIYIVSSLPKSQELWGLTVFFTIFVMLQFWNLFNMSVLGTNQSVFKHISHAWVMLSVAAVILIGQILIVCFGRTVFRTVPLSMKEWLYIIIGTSLVLWIGEIWRLCCRLKTKMRK